MSGPFPKLDSKTLVPLGAILACTIGVVTAALAIQQKLLDIVHELQAIRALVSFTVEQQRIDFDSWTRMLRAQNPTLTVPDPIRR